jgi:hypothetical protein
MRMCYYTRLNVLLIEINVVGITGNVATSAAPRRKRDSYHIKIPMKRKKEVAFDQYIIVASIMNITRQSTSKNMNEHSVCNMDMYTVLSVQMEFSVRASVRPKC